MPLIPVESIEDLRVAVYRDLPRSNLTRHGELFIAEGRLLVERLAASSCRMHSVLVDESRLGLLPSVPSDVPVFVTPRGLLKKIIGFNFHRGILACGHRPSRLTLDRVLSTLDDHALLVICVGIQDSTNLGGILRNCAAFGVDGVIVDAHCADPFSRRVLRVSMGAVWKLRIIESRDLLPDLQRLAEQSRFELAATVLRLEAERLDQCGGANRLALLIGNEAHGLPSHIIAACHRRLTIPMSLDTDSLNAAVSSGIFLHHFTREYPRQP